MPGQLATILFGMLIIVVVAPIIAALLDCQKRDEQRR
jgi:hypothetical protein